MFIHLSFTTYHKSLFRIDWLQQGSRELFGTIIEDQVYILIDVSNSMENHLGLVKEKLFKLMQVGYVMFLHRICHTVFEFSVDI